MTGALLCQGRRTYVHTVRTIWHLHVHNMITRCREGSWRPGSKEGRDISRVLVVSVVRVVVVVVSVVRVLVVVSDVRVAVVVSVVRVVVVVSVVYVAVVVSVVRVLFVVSAVRVVVVCI